ncbi:MAG: hypothetical protein WA833_01850 [Nitrosotalea sp.]
MDQYLLKDLGGLKVMSLDDVYALTIAITTKITIKKYLVLAQNIF